jgi:hypothetical protein
MVEILDRITHGEGNPDDLLALRTLGDTIKKGALCGLGQSVPNRCLRRSAISEMNTWSTSRTIAAAQLSAKTSLSTGLSKKNARAASPASGSVRQGPLQARDRNHTTLMPRNVLSAVPVTKFAVLRQLPVTQL